MSGKIRDKSTWISSTASLRMRGHHWRLQSEPCSDVRLTNRLVHRRDSIHTRRYPASHMRIDSIMSRWFFHPLGRALKGDPCARIPILMYHGIREGVSTAHPYYETNTSPILFAQHMRYLQDTGYQATDIDTAIRSIQQGDASQKCMVITFDDGYRDVYTKAYPILKECGFTATIFLPTGFISDRRAKCQDEDFMTWPEVRELVSHGFRIGSHTVTHPQLKVLALRDIDDEVSRSKQTIEDKVGIVVKSFAYPFAFPQSDKAFRQSLRQLLEKHGYQSGVCTIIGTAGNRDEQFFLPRLPINSYDGLNLFRTKLEGGYDWLRAPQYASDVVKRLRLAHHFHRRTVPGEPGSKSADGQNSDCDSIPRCHFDSDVGARKPL